MRWRQRSIPAALGLVAMMATSLAWGQPASGNRPHAKARAAAAAKAAEEARAAKAAEEAQAAETAALAADAAYRLFHRKDFTAAIDYAGRATRFAPQRRDYWLLLVQCQQAAGLLADAEQSLVRAATVRGDDAALELARFEQRRLRAAAAAQSAQRALAANDLAVAVAEARAAAGAAPPRSGYAVLLVHVLLRAGQTAEAEQAATTLSQAWPEGAAPLVLRAFARQRQGRMAEAAADLMEAAQRPPQLALEQRQLRLLAADLWLAQGAGERALDWLQPLPGDDAEAAARREAARNAAPGTALRLPGLGCGNFESVETCSLQAEPR